MRRLTLVLLTILAINIIGCAPGHLNNSPRTGQNKGWRGSTHIDAHTYAQQTFIEEALNQMTVWMQCSVKKIKVYYNNPEWEKSLGGEVVGTYDHKEDVISLRGDALDKRTIWHEAFHAFTITDHKKAKEGGREDGALYARWKQTAGGGVNEVYSYSPFGVTIAQRFPERFRKGFPDIGLLTDYSSVDPGEDIAEFGTAVLLYYAGEENLFRGANKNDKRYLNKLQLLRDSGAISRENFDAVAPLLK